MTPTIRWKSRDIKQIKIEGQEDDQIKKWKGNKRKEKKRIGKERKKWRRSEESKKKQV